MRDSYMLSSLTMGEKQHPKLGGCVRVFFQLFDWNRRLSCKKRIFSQKQLPSERHVRLAFINTLKDDSGEASLSNADADQVCFITDGEEEDNLQLKLESCSKEEEIIGGEGMEGSDDVVHKAMAPPGFCSENESIQESALLVKSPGVIGKLMGLDSLPSPSTPPFPGEIKRQKGSPTLTPVLDSPPLSSSPVIPPPHDHYLPKLSTLAFHHGLPDDELNALLSELNGNMCSILSALPPHIGISSRNRPSVPSTSTTPPTPSTTRRTSTMGVSSSCSRPTTLMQTKANTTSAGASSPSYATLANVRDVNLTCPATTIQTHVNLATGPASDFPNWTTADAANVPNASVTSITLAPNAYEERASKPHYMEGVKSREDQSMCSMVEDMSENEQKSMKWPRAAGEGNAGVTMKSGKRMKAKGLNSVGGKRLSQKSVNIAGIYGASMDMSVACSPQELQEVGRSTCKPMRRKKVDTPMQHRMQEGDVKGSPSHQQPMHYKPLEERSFLRGSPIIDHALTPHRKQEDALGVRASPNDQSSCSLASTHAATSKINCQLDHCLPSSNFAIQYNVGFFDEYHKSRAKLLPSACKSKHSSDCATEKAHKSNVFSREAVADHDHSSSNAAIHSISSGAKEESSSFIRVLIKRRAAREQASATAAMEAAAILGTALPAEMNLPAITSTSVESLHSMISSCSTTELGTDPNRREKLSAGRSEAGGGDYIQVLRPITHGRVMEDRRAVAAACSCVSGSRNCEYGGMQNTAGAIAGDSSDGGVGRWCVKSGMGNGEGVHRGMCMVGASSTAMACTKETDAGGGGVQVEICSASHAGSSKNTTAAMLQDVISALNGSDLCTPVSAARRRRHHHHHRHLFSDDDGSTPSTGDGNDTESTSESGSCWAAASQPSPVSVLIPPFDDDVSAAGDDTCWIQSEDDYVAALLAATSENGKTSLPPAELFGKLEERVIAAWPDSEVPPTRSYRRLVFDCVCEALGQAVALKEGRGNRRARARVLFEEMCRWRQGGCEVVLDDLVEAELRKACNGWATFEVQTRDIAVRLERTIFGLLVEELVCDLVLS